MPSQGDYGKVNSSVITSGEAIQLLLRKQRIKAKLVGSVPPLNCPMLTNVCKASAAEDFSLMTGHGIHTLTTVLTFYVGSNMAYFTYGNTLYSYK